MKTMYRIFSKEPILLIITLVLLLFTLQFAIFGLSALMKEGMVYFFNGNSIGLVFFALLLVIDIWLLTATFLPIIKINDQGIKACSVFWRRTIKWEDIKVSRLLKVTFTRGGSGLGGMNMNTAWVKTPVNEFKPGRRKVRTYIVVAAKMLPNQYNAGSVQMFKHKAITDKHSIAFEFEPLAWHYIQQRLNPGMEA